MDAPTTIALYVRLYYTGGFIGLPEVALDNGNYGYTALYDRTTAGVPAFFAKISDGNDDEIRRTFSYDPGFNTKRSLESVWINGGTTGTLFPDLIGTEIETAVIHVDTVGFQSPGDDPNGDGNRTNFSIKLRVEIMGHLAN